MRIVNIILTSQNGGAEQAFIDYCTALRNLGHDVLGIVKNDAPYIAEVEKLGIKVKKVKNNFGYYDPFTISDIKKILQEFDADVVFSHMGRSVVLARKAIKKIKNKKIIEIAINHSMNVKRSIGADIVLSVSKVIFFRTIDLGQSESTSFVIPNAIDLRDTIEIAPKINLSEKDTIVIGSLGRFDKAKAFRFAIKAIKILETEFPSKKFLLKIAGSGQQDKFLRDLAKELNVEDKIDFCGWIKDKKEFYSSIDIFCLPSQRETFGLVLLEAMKYRKPIISTNADGPKEILSNRIDSLIVELEPLNNTEERIALAIIEMVENPDLVNSMIENSFIRLKERFSYESLEKRLQEIVGKVSAQ